LHEQTTEIRKADNKKYRIMINSYLFAHKNINNIALMPYFAKNIAW